MIRSHHPRLTALIGGGVLLAACSAAGPAATSTGAAATAEPSVAIAAASSTPPAAASPTQVPTAALVLVSPEPSAPISNVKITVVSLNVKFSPTALTAPANKRWHLSFDLQDRLGEHNFTISSGPSVYERVYATPTVGFGLHEFVVDGLPAGMYQFVCTLHPETMKGTIEIK